MANKKDLSERDIITQFIMPAIKKAGWNIEKQVREEVYFTDGRIYVKGNKTARGERKFADIILYHKPAYSSDRGHHSGLKPDSIPVDRGHPEVGAKRRGSF